ncbi:hypothetical protein IHE45_02G028800, partial [Dioscorea alata]
IIARDAPIIISLLFTHDSLLFFKADHHEASTMKSILQIYEQVSGLKINYHKLAIIFSTNTPLQVREIVCRTLRVQEAATLFKYLGLHLWVGRKKYATFNILRDTIWGHL